MAKTSSLNKVLDDFNSSWDYASGSWHQRWNDNYYLYNNNRVKVGYQGITDTFVPMTFSTVETMTSALFGSRPRFNYYAPADKDGQNTEILNALVNNYWDQDKWSIKVINWGRDMLRYGTSVIYVHWADNKPCIINVPIRDFFIDPTANSLETAKYMGRRYLTTKKELESYEIVDLEKSQGDEVVFKKKYSNLDKVNNTKNASGENTDKEEKDMWYGSTVSEDADLVEVIEYWTADRVISVANRAVVIEDVENYFKAKAKQNGDKYPKGLMPFCALRDYVDGSLFYAKGEIDFISDQQELLNDLTNQNIDSITFSLNQMYTLDPRYAHLLEEIENIPGAIYPVEAGALSPIVQRPVPQDAFLERSNIKNEIRETTASNEIVKGVSTQGGGQQTATEIQAQIAGAGQRLALKITQIEDEGFHQLGTIVLAMIKLFVTEPMLVKVIGKEGTRWEEFDPEEFKGEYEVEVQLETTVNSQKAQQANQAKEMFAAFLNDPEVNQRELKKLVLQRGFDLDPDEVDELLGNPEEEMMPEMPEMPNGTEIPESPEDLMQPPMGQPMGEPMGQPMPQEAPQLNLTPEEEMILNEVIQGNM